MTITIGILAGGKSLRAGTNKAYLAYKGETFLNGIANRLEGFDELIVSVDSLEKYSHLQCKVVCDENQNIGPIEGIRQILKAANNDYAFICATDMPFIPKRLVEYMVTYISSDFDCYIIDDGERCHPLCAIYSKKILSKIECSIERKEYALMKMLNGLRTKRISLKYSSFTKNVLANINTMQDYKRILKPIMFCVSGIKNSGKTTLIENLITEFKLVFSRIAVIKHDGHDFSIDREGTDTYRFMEAGASQTVIYSSKKYADICLQENIALDDIFLKLKDVDVVILEGLKFSSLPKIEVVRGGVSNQSVCDPQSLIAVATNTQVENLDTNVKVISLDDAKKIAKEVLMYFG